MNEHHCKEMWHPYDNQKILFNSLFLALQGYWRSHANWRIIMFNEQKVLPRAS